MSDEKHKEYSHEEGLRLLAMTKDTYLDDCPEEYKPTVRAYRSEMFHAWVIKNAEAMLNCISDTTMAWQTATGCATVEEAREDTAVFDALLETANKWRAFAQTLTGVDANDQGWLRAELESQWRKRGEYAVPAREALERVMVGGNHLANVLIGWLGPDFSYKYPPTMDVEQAREAMANDAGSNAHDVWCCWRTTMNARAALSKCGAESNEATKEDR